MANDSRSFGEWAQDASLPVSRDAFTMDLKKPDVNPNTEKDPAGQDWDDVIGLRNIVFVVAAWWREIVLGVFLAAVMGGMVSVALDAVLPRYDASTNVAIIYDATRSDRNLEGQRAALVGLIHHESVAKRVLERLRLDGLLEESSYTTEYLFKAVSAELVTSRSLAGRSQSDLIRIRAEADSLERAVAIADTWTEEYVLEINRQYEQEPLSSMIKIRARTDEAAESYESTQRALEEMINDSKIHRLRRQIRVNKNNITKLHNIRNEIATTLLNRQIDGQLDLLDQYYGIRLRLNKLLGVAESLRAQVESGGEAGAASNELAIMLFKVHAYAVMDDLPNKLEIGLDNARTAHAKVADQSADMDAVIAALKDRIARISQDIAHQSNSLSAWLLIEEAEEDLPIQSREEKAQDAPDSQSWGLLLQLSELNGYSDANKGPMMRHIEEIEDRTRLLEMQLEAETVKRRDLEQSRDRARSHLESLLEENNRVILETSFSRPVLRLASSAATEGVSLWPSPAPVAAVSGVAGLLVMLLFAFSMDSLGVRPFLKKRGAEHTVRARGP